MRVIHWVAAATMLCCGTSVALADAGEPAPRAVVPIQQRLLRDGAKRYTIPIQIGATSIEAGLDSGSTGLRVLPGVLTGSDAKPGHRRDRYAYGAGTEFEGVVADGQLSIGRLAGPVTLQLIHRVRCVDTKPHCPASRVPLTQFGIQGDGIPGAGFKAIIGVSMAEADVASPLRAIGARRWIVELPRPTEAAPGRLILNPTADETNDFIMLPIERAFRGQKGGLHDAIAGCLLNNATKAKACGAVALDTGAPGIRLVNGGLGRNPWRPGTAATLAFYDGRNLRAAELISIDRRSQGSHLMFGSQPKRRQTVIFSGLAAYFAYDVLYDPGHDRIGLRPRPQAPGGPEALSVPTDR